MKKNILGITTLSLLLGTLAAMPALADSAKVGVNGMVCAFCAQGIKKNFSAKTEVEKVEVNLDAHLVTLDFKQGQSLNDEEITKVIKSAGYAVAKIEREGAKK